jgi:NADH-quinone oxidoreductase subunit A
MFPGDPGGRASTDEGSLRVENILRGENGQHVQYLAANLLNGERFLRDGGSSTVARRLPPFVRIETLRMITDQIDLWTFGLYVAAVFAVIASMLGFPALLGERHWNKPERQTEIGTGVPYESGVWPTGSAQLRLPVQYYLVAMFFVIFDVEAVFLYAWTLVVPEAGWMGFIEAAIFIVILLAALFYVWRVGALDWSARYQRPSVHRLTNRRTPSEDKGDGDVMVA